MKVLLVARQKDAQGMYSIQNHMLVLVEPSEDLAERLQRMSYDVIFCCDLNCYNQLPAGVTIPVLSSNPLLFMRAFLADVVYGLQSGRSDIPHFVVSLKTPSNKEALVSFFEEWGISYSESLEGAPKSHVYFMTDDEAVLKRWARQGKSVFLVTPTSVEAFENFMKELLYTCATSEFYAKVTEAPVGRR